MPDPWLTAKQVAAGTGRSVRTVRDLAKAGRFSALCRREKQDHGEVYRFCPQLADPEVYGQVVGGAGRRSPEQEYLRLCHVTRIAAINGVYDGLGPLATMLYRRENAMLDAIAEEVTDES